MKLKVTGRSDLDKMLSLVTKGYVPDPLGDEKSKVLQRAKNEFPGARISVTPSNRGLWDVHVSYTYHLSLPDSPFKK